MAQKKVGSWYNPATPSDVRDEQQRVRAARDALNAALQTSKPTGDPAAIDTAVRGWNGTSADVDKYLGEEPGVFWWTRDEQVQHGKNLESQIESWRLRFARLNVDVPEKPAPAPSDSGGLLGLGNMSGLSTALLLIGAAMLLGKLKD